MLPSERTDDMKKLFTTALLLAIFPIFAPRPPIPPKPGPTRPPVDCKLTPRPCPPLPGK